jgi:hypothetical protein
MVLALGFLGLVLRAHGLTSSIKEKNCKSAKIVSFYGLKILDMSFPVISNQNEKW